MLDRFLATKLYLPHLRPGTIARPRLVTLLDGTPPAGIAVLAAPAGFGKTVAAVQWLNAQRGLRALASSTSAPAAPSGDGVRGPHERLEQGPAIAWLALDAADNDAGRFWSALVAAVHAASPNVAPGATALLRARGSLDSEALVAGLIHALVDADRPWILALDHLNAIDDPAVLGALGLLLEHLPESARALLTTRVEPPLPTTRWRVADRLIELTEADLRFSCDEVRAYLQAHDLPADDDGVAKLTETTEGWIAGVVLAARAARDRGIDSVLASFDGGHRFVGDYLAAEVLDRQPDSVRAFLIDTAVLDRLSGPLCDAVTGAAAGTSQSILEQLDAENLFIVPLDDTRQWYRYHRLFADALRARLTAQRTPADIQALHRYAADWYRDNGFVVRAVRHSLEAGDEAEAADLILAAADASWTLGRAATLRGWIRALPADAIDRHPRLGIYEALTQVLMGQSLETVEPMLRGLDDTMAGDTPDWRGRLSVVRGIAAGVRGQSDVAAAESRAAMDLLNEDNLPWRGLATIDLGLAELSRGEPAAAARAFAEARGLGIRAANPYATLAASVNLARAHHADGALHAAAAAYREALACADENALQGLPLTGLAHVGLGDVLREWNACEEADERIDAGLRLAEDRHVHVRVAVAGHLARARLRLAQSRLEDVGTSLNAAEALAMRYDRAEYLADVHAVRALLALQTGDPGPALRWAVAEGRRTTGPSTDGPRSDEATGDLMLLARLALFEGDDDAAAQHVARLAAALHGVEGRLAERIELGLLEARLAYARGDRAAATAATRSMLALAQPEGYVRTVVDEGAVAATLLALIVEPGHGVAPEPAGEVLARYAAELAKALGPMDPGPWAAAANAIAPTGAGDPVTARTSGATAAANADLLEPLSARELEVLAAVADGATNQEIADRLVIALSTVKTHINNIFGKLGVRSRTQAVAHARSIGLL
ncbi:MAG: LuxR C-terminal-related transcriptional regulator [Ardenticatenales bacterium]